MIKRRRDNKSTQTLILVISQATSLLFHFSVWRSAWQNASNDDAGDDGDDGDVGDSDGDGNV